METLAFILGMLSIIGVILLATIVWGIVKIVKLVKTTKRLEDDAQAVQRMFWDTIEGIRRDADIRSENLERHLYSEIKDAAADCKSYTDSRIDKLIDSMSAKTVIKG